MGLNHFSKEEVQASFGQAALVGSERHAGSRSDPRRPGVFFKESPQWWLFRVPCQSSDPDPTAFRNGKKLLVHVFYRGCVSFGVLVEWSRTTLSEFHQRDAILVCLPSMQCTEMIHKALGPEKCVVRPLWFPFNLLSPTPPPPQKKYLKEVYTHTQRQH